MSFMIKVRLSRGGKKNQPFYRIVAIESTRKRGGRALDNLGYWNPISKDFSLNQSKLKNWTEKGAQLSKSLQKLITENS